MSIGGQEKETEFERYSPKFGQVLRREAESMGLPG